MADLVVPSGATVIINTASWKDAKALKKAIEREVAASGFTLSGVLMVDSSDAVDAALWPCLVRCTYNNEKITELTFDKPGARADYYDIVMACIKENLGPLAESLRSKLIEHGLVMAQANTEESQKQASPTSASSSA